MRRPPHPTFPLRRILRSASLLVWFGVRTASAQSQEALYGELRRMTVSGAVDSPLMVAPWQSGRAVLILPSSSQQSLFWQIVDSNWTVVEERPIQAPRHFDEAMLLQGGSSRSVSLGLVDRPANTIHIVSGTYEDTLQVRQNIAIPFTPSMVVAADVTGDGRTDLLVADRNVPGILPYIATAQGKYVPRALIAPDQMVGTFVVAALNNDRLNDIVAYDWVRSEVQLWYGVGGGRFIDQNRYPLEVEVQQIAAANTSRYAPAAFAFSCNSAREVRYWLGSDFGEFTQTGALAFDAEVSSLFLANIDTDGVPDMVASTADGLLSVSLGGDTTAFSEEARLALSVESPRLTPFPGAFGSPELIVTSPGNKTLTVIRRAGMPLMNARQTEFMTGRTPVGVVAERLDRDAPSDLVVINARERTVDAYWGRGDRRLRGPISHRLGSTPSSIAVHSVSDTAIHLLVGSIEEQSVSVLSYDLRDRSLSGSVVPTEGKPALLNSFPAASGLLGFAALNILQTTERFSLSFFEQLGPDRFIEQNFRLLSPAILCGAAVARVDSDDIPDIVYAFTEHDTSNVAIAVAFGDSVRSLNRRSLLQTLPIHGAHRVRLWCVDLDGDGTNDILAHASEPSMQFWWMRGTSSGSFAEPVLLGEPVDIASVADVRFSAQGKETKVLVLDRLTRSVRWIVVGPESASWHDVVVDAHVVAFDAGDFDGNGEIDIAAVLQAPDLLRIHWSAFREEAATATMGVNP